MSLNQKHTDHDDPFDRGFAADFTTLLSRRRALGLLAGGVGTVALAACGASSSGTSSSANGPTDSTSDGSSTSTATKSSGSLVEIPDETNGPYPADGTNGPDILETSGVVRRDITSSFGGASGTADGVPLAVTFSLIDMANDNAPYAGAAVYAWQCDALGRYSMYSDGVTDENFLRGVQVADKDGNVTFDTIFPGCYSGRWPHIHFEVYPDVDSITDHDKSVSTSQAALPESESKEIYTNDDRYEGSERNFSQISIDSDNVFDPDTIAQQMLSLTGNRTKGFTASLTVPIDTTTEQQMDAPPSGGGGPGGGPGMPG